MTLTHKELTRLKARYRLAQAERELRETESLWTRFKEFVFEFVSA